MNNQKLSKKIGQNRTEDSNDVENSWPKINERLSRKQKDRNKYWLTRIKNRRKENNKKMSPMPIIRGKKKERDK